MMVTKKSGTKPQSLLIINWRSIKDPLEGGAERATFEFAKRWVKDFGVKVFWLAPRYDKKITQETIEGVNFYYVGLPLRRNVLELLFTFPLFYFLVIITYLRKFRGKVDLVIDQFHGIPYLTPLYVKEKKIVYIHEVAEDIWDHMYPFPINMLGKLLEKIVFLPYKKIKFIANSESTQAALVKKAKIPKKNTKIVYYGVTAPLIKKISPKEKDLTVVYLNRIVKMKGIERGLRVFAMVQKQHPKAKMWVVGSGEDAYIYKLKDLCNELGIQQSVLFKGFIDGNKKFELLGKAHVLMNPSFLEGWGLVNIEANRMGTPVVAFKVRGCVDSVKNGISGYLVKDGNLKEMAAKILSLVGDEKLRKSAQEYAKQFDWDIQATKFYEEL